MYLYFFNSDLFTHNQRSHCDSLAVFQSFGLSSGDDATWWRKNKIQFFLCTYWISLSVEVRVNKWMSTILVATSDNEAYHYCYCNYYIIIITIIIIIYIFMFTSTSMHALHLYINFLHACYTYILYQEFWVAAAPPMGIRVGDHHTVAGDWLTVSRRGRLTVVKNETADITSLFL